MAEWTLHYYRNGSLAYAWRGSNPKHIGPPVHSRVRLIHSLTQQDARGLLQYRTAIHMPWQKLLSPFSYSELNKALAGKLYL
jgi:hypothetical protein